MCRDKRAEQVDRGRRGPPRGAELGVLRRLCPGGRGQLCAPPPRTGQGPKAVLVGGGVGRVLLSGEWGALVRKAKVGQGGGGCGGET